MNMTISNYIVIVTISSVLSALLAIYGYLIKSSFAGMRAYIWTSICSAIYTFGFAFELASDSLAEIRFWIGIEYLGLPFISPATLVLILYFTGMDRFVTRKMLIWLFTIPFITLLLVVTNEWHHMFYRSIFLRPNESVIVADIVFGEWYIINGSFTFGCLVVSAYLLLRQWTHAKMIYRKQLLMMAAGIFIPMTASFMYLLDLTPHGMDIVPPLMFITSILNIWAILTSNILKAAPIARERIFESMRDGVIVLDMNGRIADYNRSASQMIASLRPTAIGTDFKDIWLLHTGQAADFIHYDEEFKHHEREVRWIQQHTSLPSFYLVRSSPVHSRKGELIGRTIVLMDITEKAILQEKLKQMATIDGLTGIYNRAYFLEQARLLLHQAMLNQQPFSLILFDIDHFKSINDRFGHDIGDLALCHVVAVCQEQLSDSDLFGRYGGEEFIICLPAAAPNEAGEIAEKLRRALAGSPLQTQAGSVPLSASFGAAGITIAEHAELDEMIREADKALYQSKNMGRNAVHIFSK
ncbi:histidine kinase N-terminal 7TM domain-containing protein [Paenibacillus algorifonticola]|uniref:histidine kinase N-terminal 7TM domain-containing diguanylate cyclase n=1 Tax=Paenibacillus algorifonticola TaxID=684063 RepID=UPI003D2A4A89